MTRADYPQTLGIIAGGGTLPQTLISFCHANHINPFVIGIDGHVQNGLTPFIFRLGAAGQMIKILKGRGIQNIVIIGSVTRPSFLQLRPDLHTAIFFAKLGLRALGDDGLLKAVRAELETEGFKIHGIQDFIPDLLMPNGLLSKAAPNAAQNADIALGFKECEKLGLADLGQSVIVHDGCVLGVEDAKGTNALIKSAGARGAILVKAAKPNQDRALDLPTLGPETVSLCGAMGMAGIAGAAGDVLLTDRVAMVKMADNLNLFMVGQ
jgi:UDP-2,3-diacylglucosamine hydrolase